MTCGSSESLDRMDEILSVAELCHQFPTPSGPLTVLEHVNLSLKAGDALAITGPSGSGKSTLLFALGALERPTAGTVKIGGTDVFQLNSTERAAFRNRKIGFIFQEHFLLPQCNVLENVLIPTLADRCGADDVSRARELLARVGLADRLKHRPGELSGGERQRVAVCRGLIRQPQVVLADEPTGSLDEDTTGVVGDLLLDLCGELQTVLVCVTHSAVLADRFPLRRTMRHRTLVADTEVSA